MSSAFPNPTVQRIDGALTMEEVALADVAARFGTPTYVYSRRAIVEAYQRYHRAFSGIKHRIHYAVKANSNLAVIDVLAQAGAGFDIVSGGELMRVIAAGGDASQVIFSGVAKTAKEMTLALRQGINCFNIESEAELYRLNEVARDLNLRAPIAFRVNPDVDAKTHPYISTGLKANKFGVAHQEAERLYVAAAAMKHVEIVGIECHIGSQLLDVSPYEDAMKRLLELTDRIAAKGIVVEHIDIGGGVGINYQDGVSPDIEQFAATMKRLMQGRPQTLYLEPGRSLVGNAGVLLTNVEYLKHGETKNFAIVDAGMNDLIRPSLYSAYHEIVEVALRERVAARAYDVVGPVCESTCFLGRDRHLRIEQSDLLAVLSAGAYAFAMASNYNTRARACEVMIDGAAMHLIRERDEIESLFAHERVLPR